MDKAKLEAEKKNLPELLNVPREMADVANVFKKAISVSLNPPAARGWLGRTSDRISGALTGAYKSVSAFLEHMDNVDRENELEMYGTDEQLDAFQTKMEEAAKLDATRAAAFTAAKDAAVAYKTNKHRLEAKQAKLDAKMTVAIGKAPIILPPGPLPVQILETLNEYHKDVWASEYGTSTKRRMAPEETMRMDELLKSDRIKDIMKSGGIDSNIRLDGLAKCVVSFTIQEFLRRSVLADYGRDRSVRSLRREELDQSVTLFMDPIGIARNTAESPPIY